MGLGHEFYGEDNYNTNMCQDLCISGHDLLRQELFVPRLRKFKELAQGHTAGWG